MSEQGQEEFGTESVENFSQIARDKSCNALASGTKFVRENPVPVVLGALLVGTLLGLLLAPRERRPREASKIAREFIDTVYDEIAEKIPTLKKQYTTTKANLVEHAQDLGSKLKWW